MSNVPISEGGTVLAFLNEVAGGRKLLNEIRDRVDAGAGHVVLVAPQNQPVVGQIVDADEVYEAALSRVEVTQEVLHAFGIRATATVLDPDSLLALDDGVRAYKPGEVLISSLPETRLGFARKDLIEWARARFDVPVTHVPVRIEDDAVRWDVTHTLVVATQTVNAPDLVERLIARHKESPHRYTFVSPASGDAPREEVCDRLAATLAALYKEDIDATGQPMSPEPFAAVKNAIEHYRIDDILISTFAGRSSKWLEDGLIDEVKEFSDFPVEHFESSGGAVQQRGVPAVGAAQEVNA
jgi:GABA permease